MSQIDFEDNTIFETEPLNVSNDAKNTQSNLKGAFTETGHNPLSDTTAQKQQSEQAIDNQGVSIEIKQALANIKNINELLSNNKPINWIIKKHIPTQSIIMMHGESGVGKTFVTLDMTLSIAYGISDWFGCKIKQKYNVLYFSGEGNNAIGKRVKAFIQERKLQRQTGNFILCDNAIPLMLKGKTNKDIKTFIEMLPFRPDLIVFDTVNIFMNEGDENSNTDCGRFMDTIRELNREFNCTTLLIHHTGKDQNQKSNPRGASALRAAVDIEISILKETDTDNTLKIMQTKNKDTEIQEPFYLKKEIVNLKNTFDEDGIQETSIVLKPVNKAQDKEIATIQKQKENLKKIVLYHGKSVIIKGLNEKQEIQLTRNHLEKYFEHKGGQNPTNQAEVFTSRDIEQLIKLKFIHKTGKGKNCILSINNNEWTDDLLNEINSETAF